MKEFKFDTCAGSEFEIRHETKTKRSRSKKSKDKQIEGQQKIGSSNTKDSNSKTETPVEPEIKAEPAVTSIEDTVENDYSQLTPIQMAVRSASSDIAKMNSELEYAREHPYFACDRLLTRAEEKLYKKLLTGLNNRLKCINKSIVIFPKMRLADIVNTHRSTEMTHFYKIACKHVDFVVCDTESLSLITAVELDDDYHNRSDRIERDRFVDETLRYCGIQIFHVNKPINQVTDADLSPIIDYVISSYCPVCPSCGGIMEMKRSRRQSNYGHRFFGCNNWKSDGSGCNYNIDIE